MHSGDTFLMPIGHGKPRAHLWIIVTEPAADGKYVAVNVTSKNPDTTVILQKGDHPFIQHASAVRFSDATFGNVAQLEATIRGGAAQAHTRCSSSVLQRVQAGILASIYTPIEVREYCKGLWLRDSDR